MNPRRYEKKNRKSSDKRMNLKLNFDEKVHGKKEDKLNVIDEKLPLVYFIVQITPNFTSLQ
jgi:hypothetical protein